MAFLAARSAARECIVPLDDFSGWTLPPPSALDTGPVRAFDTPEEALAFLKTLHDIAVGAQRTRPMAA